MARHENTYLWTCSYEIVAMKASVEFEVNVKQSWNYGSAQKKENLSLLLLVLK